VRIAAEVDETTLERTREAIRALRNAGMSILILAAPRAMYSGLDAFGNSASTVELMRLLKRQFDPRSVLNPGRVIPEL
jgi:FAD/FMN-containing dehydrogenase